MSKIVAKVSLTPDERDHLDAQAKALSMSRSELMRLRALGDPSVGSRAELPPLTLCQYQRAVTAALKAAQGACSRITVEAVTAAVLCSIHDIPDQPRNPSHPESVG